MAGDTVKTLLPVAVGTALGGPAGTAAALTKVAYDAADSYADAKQQQSRANLRHEQAAARAAEDRLKQQQTLAQKLARQRSLAASRGVGFSGSSAQALTNLNAAPTGKSLLPEKGQVPSLRVLDDGLDALADNLFDNWGA